MGFNNKESDTLLTAPYLWVSLGVDNNKHKTSAYNFIPKFVTLLNFNC